MPKLFFSDALPELRIDNIRAMRERQERKLAQLRAIEQHGGEGMHRGPYLTLELGIGPTQALGRRPDRRRTRARGKRRSAASRTT
jgi:hypothetical protein